ncbi:hypothetical protein HDU98_002676 [Podochytrium sp. JEL0797]|nr:hypothetical protein HDU98_002676 [Podochytrium sp. JEL0797]
MTNPGDTDALESLAMLANAANAAVQQDVPSIEATKESPSTSPSTKITLPPFSQLPFCRSPITIPSQPYHFQGHQYPQQQQQPVHPARFIRSNSIAFPYVQHARSAPPHFQYPQNQLQSVLERRHSYAPPSAYGQPVRVFPPLPSPGPTPPGPFHNAQSAYQSPQVYFHHMQQQPPPPDLTSSPSLATFLSLIPKQPTYIPSTNASPTPSNNHIVGLRANKRQLKVLFEVFAETPMPTATKHDEIAERIGMSKKAVRNWFQNTRAKMRRLANQRVGDVKSLVKEGAGGGGGVQQGVSPVDSREEKEDGELEEEEEEVVESGFVARD